MESRFPTKLLAFAGNLLPTNAAYVGACDTTNRATLLATNGTDCDVDFTQARPFARKRSGAQTPIHITTVSLSTSSSSSSLSSLTPVSHVQAERFQQRARRLFVPATRKAPEEDEAAVVAQLEERTYLRMQPVDDAVKDVVKGMAKNIAKTMAKAFGGKILAGLTSNLGLATDQSMCDQLMQKLIPELTGLIGQGLAPNVAVGTAAMLEEAILHAIQTQTVDAIADMISEKVSPQVSNSLAEAIVPNVKQGIPEELALDSVRPLVHTLSRALPHAIAPALTQTIRHSPNQDYMCYDCFKEGKNCAFCHYAPLQTMYASFYASVFSQHYSDYYSDYFYEYFRQALRPAPGEQPIQTLDDGQSLGDRSEDQPTEEYVNNYGPEVTVASQ